MATLFNVSHIAPGTIQVKGRGQQYVIPDFTLNGKKFCETFAIPVEVYAAATRLAYGEEVEVKVESVSSEETGKTV